MAPHDPTWGDTGFGDGEDGFLRPNDPGASKPTTPPVPDPASDAGSQAATPDDGGADDAAAARRRVAMPPAPEPLPPPQRRRRSAAPWIWGIGGVALLLGGLWFGYDRLTRPTLEEELFTEVAKDATEEAVVEQRVDSSFVVRTETQPVPIAPIESVSTPKTTPRPERQRQPDPKKPSAAPAPRSVAPPSVPTTVQKSTKTDALYVVQVFSSPSQDDAEEWLGVLRERQIADGYITEQQIKGQTWYRVRFGQFATRAAAEDAAVELGLRQPWIARVR